MEQATEEWRAIPTEPNYAVSNLGRVRHLRKDKILPQYIRGKWGKYICVYLSNQGCRRTVNVHRLVAQFFLPPPPSLKHQIAHNDGNPANNHVSNLRWATRRENMSDCVRHGTRRRGAKVNTCKLNEQQVHEIRKDCRRAQDIARDYGVTYQAIYAIQRRISWAWLT